MVQRRALFTVILSGLSQALVGMEPAGNGEQPTFQQSLLQPKVDTPHPKNKERISLPTSPQPYKDLSPFQLATKGDVKKVKEHLDEHLDAINKFNPRGNTLLHCAINGAAVCEINDYASLKNYEELFQLLLERGANPDLKSNKPQAVSARELLNRPGKYAQINDLFYHVFSTVKGMKEFTLLESSEAQPRNAMTRSKNSSWVEKKLEARDNKENGAETKSDLARSQFLASQDLSATSHKAEGLTLAQSAVSLLQRTPRAEKKGSVRACLFPDLPVSSASESAVEKKDKIPFAALDPRPLAQSVVFSAEEQKEDRDVAAAKVQPSIDLTQSLYFENRAAAEKVLGLPPAESDNRGNDIPAYSHTPAPDVQAPQEVLVFQGSARAGGEDLTQAVYYGNALEAIRLVLAPVQKQAEPTQVAISAQASIHPAIEKLINAHPEVSLQPILPVPVVASIIRQQEEQGARIANPVAPVDAALSSVAVHNKPLSEMPHVGPQRSSLPQTDFDSMQQEQVIHSHQPYNDEPSGGFSEPNVAPSQQAPQVSKDLNVWSKRLGAALGVGFAGVVFYKWLKQVQARVRQKQIHAPL